jgi:hypothetical protein
MPTTPWWASSIARMPSGSDAAKVMAEFGLKSLSSTQVSRAAALLDEELAVWRSRPLGEIHYLFLDARYEKLREGGVVRDAALFSAIGIGPDGRRRVLGVERIDAVADRGYYKGEDIQACEDAGIAAYVARPQRGAAVREGLFRKEEFRYDPTSDTYRCPGGQHLYPRYRCGKGDHTTVQYCNRDACRGCELKPQCMANTYRRVGRWTDEAVLERMEARLAARPEILKQRREIAEHPFGSIKQWMNQGAFLLRGLEKVRAEFSLTALAYNFIRVVNIMGVASLLKAV